MTTSTADPDTDVGTDTSDLDYIDDEPTTHVLCARCQSYTAGVPFTAMCGKRVIDFRPIANKARFATLPADLCVSCLAAVLARQPCPKCGVRR